ncbi:MAG TPA: malto-oligosyltrehalose synthase [Bryobacteraceae bacterium]|nr:malto-oligosyltrehalose synthase [Bryobacteraceae bacterium]
MSRTPVATYRLQLHKEFDFDKAAAIAGYLHKLGISHVYSSPYLQAAPGSKHGYDVVDHHRVNQELGGEEAHERFCKRLGEFHLGQVLDIVPNHMAIAGRHNRYWWDVLENGPSSLYAPYFDIDWLPVEEKLRNKVLVPILGDHYGRVLARHEISVKRHEGEFLIEYFDHHLPAAPRSLPYILSNAATRISSDYLSFLSDAVANLPSATETDRASVLARHRDKEVVRALLARFCGESPSAAAAIDAELEELNRDIDSLDLFLERQNFRLSFWKTAGEELMYRRFFDVNTLVGLRMEDEAVFADTHSLIFDWIRRGVLDGIRIDHPDGLRNPEQYFQRLRAATDGWIVAEKIVEPGEPLRSSWPIAGTTGYDFLYQAGGLFIDSKGLEHITAFYERFTGESTAYQDMCREKKHMVMREILVSDVNRLVSLFVQVCESHRDHRDYTRTDISRTLREIVACFPVYRTYIVSGTGNIDPLDARYINEAVERAKQNREELDQELFDFIRDVLLLKFPGRIENEFIMRFQQFTGPAMAKGVEDTTFYCYNRLTSANEVGGDPGSPVVTAPQFHAYCAGLQVDWPETMLALSTHDTKRSEDVRTRIHVLTEIPDRWQEAVERWTAMNRAFKTADYPDANTEYLIYQTMVGAWPVSFDRLSAYMQKATREAKRMTSWINPNEQFDNALQGFLEKITSFDLFLSDLESFVKPLVEPGRISSLAQTLLKMTAPGVPDLYQGTELWDLSLVDPDNRRPVDYELRSQLLSELPRLNMKEIWNRQDEGLPKLWLIHQTLRVRRDHSEAFSAAGSYKPIEAQGEKASHILSFLRGGAVATVAQRLPLTVNSNWGDTSIELSRGQWRNVLAGETTPGGTIRLGNLFAAFPVALLIRQKEQ